MTFGEVTVAARYGGFLSPDFKIPKMTTSGQQTPFSRVGSFASRGKRQEKISNLRPQSYYFGYPKLLRTYRNKLITFLWPGSLLNMSLIMGGVIAVRLTELSMMSPVTNTIIILEDLLPFTDAITKMISGGALSGIAVFALITFCRRMLLRNLLAYRGWMNDPPGKLSNWTITWAILVKFLSGWTPSMYSYQSCLPRMPVPPLKETMEKLLVSMEAIFELQPSELVDLRASAKQFEENVGSKLQRALVLRSLWCDNFVSDWWESYVYLMNRSPLAINSNYYIMDHCYWTPTTNQCARAAATLYQILLVREQILTEDFDPLVIRKFIPVCMSQYKRVFSTTRVPGEEMDTLVHYPPSQSQHVVVSRRGLMYMLNIADSYGELVPPSQLERQLRLIEHDADSRYNFVSESERLVPALTSQDRTSWAKARKEFFSQGVNKETLHHLESAILHLVLDHESFPDLSTKAAHLLHGGVGSLWFDKSMQIVVMNDGYVGMNCEHSYADAPIVAHIFEHSLTIETIMDLYDDEGHCLDPYPSMARCKFTPLMWEMDERLEDMISRACSHAEKNIQDLDLVVFDHYEFGKGDIKQCKISPDAFIQMSLNTTYRKLAGVPVLTYEASMTRLFKHGRTETVRSLTPEANHFVNTFLNPLSTKEQKKAILRLACKKHATLYKDAMNGKGIDRHLFALYVASRGMSLNSEFLKKVLSFPWTLSTSQQPQQQIAWAPSCADVEFQHLLSPGGGFGPVAENGYGVSYMVAGDLRIFFHISSRRSGSGTSSSKFLETLEVTMKEMIALYDLDVPS